MNISFIFRPCAVDLNDTFGWRCCCCWDTRPNFDVTTHFWWPLLKLTLKWILVIADFSSSSSFRWPICRDNRLCNMQMVVWIDRWQEVCYECERDSFSWWQSINVCLLHIRQYARANSGWILNNFIILKWVPVPVWCSAIDHHFAIVKYIKFVILVLIEKIPVESPNKYIYILSSFSIAASRQEFQRHWLIVVIFMIANRTELGIVWPPSKCQYSLFIYKSNRPFDN